MSEEWEDQIAAALREIRDTRSSVERLLAIEDTKRPLEAELRVSIARLDSGQSAQGERLARVETSLLSLTGENDREERSQRRWAVLVGTLIGVDGYLRSWAFLTVCGLLAVAVGWITVDQAIAYMRGATVLVPVAPAPP